jgi:hypothetical protein
MGNAFILIKTTKAGEGRVKLEALVFDTRAARDSAFQAVVGANEALPPHPLGGFFEPLEFVQAARAVADMDGIDEAVAEAASNAAWNYRHKISGEDAAVDVEIRKA